MSEASGYIVLYVYRVTKGMILVTTWTSKVCKIMTLMVILRVQDNYFTSLWGLGNDSCSYSGVWLRDGTLGEAGLLVGPATTFPET